MIGRKTQTSAEVDAPKPQGFDDFTLRLGDVMRGERATLGKSLLDVQRELRIKASYIAAIENCDPTAFDTPGFIAGYVRSYARYLGMDPDETFNLFCEESGFANPHGMSDQASSLKKPFSEQADQPTARDPFAHPNLAFAPAGDSIFSQIEPRAIGSVLVLIGLISGIGYGGYTVLQEVQRVQLVPVEQTPVVLSELDPLQAAVQPVTPAGGEDDTVTGPEAAGVFTPPSNEALDRLYRPQALDVPVLVARDAPISTLDPSSVGAFAGVVPESRLPDVGPAPSDEDRAATLAAIEPETEEDGLMIVAARPAWVRVRDGEGAILFEQIMAPGATWTVPADATGPELNVGESGALYFMWSGKAYGPFGPAGQGTYDLPLEVATLLAVYAAADSTVDADLGRVLAELAVPETPLGTLGNPQVVEAAVPPMVIVAVQETWVRVRSADGSNIYEAVMQPGDTWTVPQTESPPSLRTGNAGGVYFAVNGTPYGPVGGRGAVESGISLAATDVPQTYARADLSRSDVLQRVVAELRSGTPVAE